MLDANALYDKSVKPTDKEPQLNQSDLYLQKTDPEKDTKDYSHHDYDYPPCFTPDKPSDYVNHDYDYPPCFTREGKLLSSEEAKQLQLKKLEKAKRSKEKPLSSLPPAGPSGSKPGTSKPSNCNTLPSSPKSLSSDSQLGERNSNTLPSSLRTGRTATREGKRTPPPVPSKPGRTVRTRDLSPASDSEADESNPWRVNLKKSLKPNLDNFKGEKCFSKHTAVTNLVLPGFESKSGKADGSTGSLSSAGSGESGAREKTPTKSHSDSESAKPEPTPKKDKVTVDTNTAKVDIKTTKVDTDIAKVDTISTTPVKKLDQPKTESSPRVSSGSSTTSSVSVSSLSSAGSANGKELNKMDVVSSPLGGSTQQSPKQAFPVSENGYGPNLSLTPDSVGKLKPSLSNNASKVVDSKVDFQFIDKLLKDTNEGLEMNGVVVDDDLVRNSALPIDLDLDDLTGSQQELRDLHERMRQERKREQEEAAQEKQRLEDILNMCAEYEKQLDREKLVADQQKRSSGSDSPIDKRELRNSKIKTNGSLTKLASPNQCHKEMAAFDFKFRRSSNSSSTSTSEDEAGSENGTIKRRPNGAGYDTSNSLPRAGHIAHVDNTEIPGFNSSFPKHHTTNSKSLLPTEQTLSMQLKTVTVTDHEDIGNGNDLHISPRSPASETRSTLSNDSGHCSVSKSNSTELHVETPGDHILQQQTQVGNFL